jgi:transcriptional regulator with XRE-family HTH domain
MKPKELRHWLKTKGVNQSEIAVLVGVSRPLVTLWTHDGQTLPLWLDYVMESQRFKNDIVRLQNERFDRKMARSEKRK